MMLALATANKGGGGGATVVNNVIGGGGHSSPSFATHFTAFLLIPFCLCWAPYCC